MLCCRSYYGIIYWAPMFVNLVLGRGASTSTKADVTVIGLTAIPYGVAAIWQVGAFWFVRLFTSCVASMQLR